MWGWGYKGGDGHTQCMVCSVVVVHLWRVGVYNVVGGVYSVVGEGIYCGWLVYSVVGGVYCAMGGMYSEVGVYGGVDGGIHCGGSVMV